MFVKSNFSVAKQGILFALISFIILIAFSPLQAEQQLLADNKEHNLASLESSKKAAESDSSLNEQVKSQVIDFYNQAIQAFHESKIVQDQVKLLNNITQSAPKRINEIQKQLLADDKIDERSWAKLPIDKLELLLKQYEFQLQQNKNILKEKEAELNKLLIDGAQTSEKINATNKILQRINQDLQTSSSEHKTLQKARFTALKMRQTLRQAEIDLAQLYFNHQDVLTSLAQAERDLLLKQINKQQRQQEILLKLTQQLREQKALEDRQRAEQSQQKTSLLPELQKIADETTAFRIELENIIKEEQVIGNRLINTQDNLEKIKFNYKHIQQRVNLLGATDEVSKLLRKHKTFLPSTVTYHNSSKKLFDQIANVTYRQLEIDDLQRDTANHQFISEQLMTRINSREHSLPTSQIEQQIHQHLEAKRDALNALQKAYTRYINLLSAIDLASRERFEVASNFSQYIDDQLLWIPNTNWKQLIHVELVFSGLAWMINKDNLQHLSSAIWQVMSHPKLLNSFCYIACFLLLFYRHKIILYLRHICQASKKVRTDSYYLTMLTLIITILLAAPFALLSFITGWSLLALESELAYIQVLGNGFVIMGIIIFALKLMIHNCRRSGLAINHLRWPKEVCLSIAQNTAWLLVYLAPLSFFITLGNNLEIPVGAQLVGHYAFILSVIFSTIFIFRLFNANSVLIQYVLKKNSESLMYRLHFFWFPVLLAISIGLMVMVIFGYQYTAWKLQQQIQLSIWVLISIILVKDLMLRWLYLNERRFRFNEAIRYREELIAQQNGETEFASSNTEEVVEVNYSELSEQARRLLYAGFLFGVIIAVWLIWREWIPSLNLFFKTELPMYTSVTIDGISKTVPLTLADIIIAFFTLLITFLAGKNLPGVLEITLLQHLHIDPGSRYAITTLSQYVIFGIGVFLAFSHLGLEWSKIQWLVAALSVGLGFGLQEIVANFISGIILLFERPVRAGDFVTVGDASGTINKINIRATTITTYDRQELLVPNKEFITGRVLNWTLSNKVNRVIISVGVAYDSDIDLAMELLYEAASEGSKVLIDPPPFISFDTFGDSALLLSVRCYLEDMGDRVDTITEVNKLVLKKYRDAGIEIAFPQQDVHFRSKQPISVRIMNDNDEIQK